MNPPPPPPSPPSSTTHPPASFDNTITTPPPPTPPILQRKLSFDSSEPKTLFEHEMNLAREAALHIMNTHTKEDALKIFLAGWVPVTTMAAKQPNEEVGVTSDGDED